MPSSTELAKSHLEGQRRLLDDARKREAKAAKVRADAEAAHAKASAKHQESVARSAADPSEDCLVDDANRNATRVQHAKVALDQAVAQHATVAREVADREGHVQAGERSLELAGLEEDLRGDGFDRLVSEAAQAAVSAVVGLRAALATIRGALVDDNAKAARFRALGGVIADRDATGPAAHLSQALLDAGAVHPSGQQGENHGLRWALNLPTEYPDPRTAPLYSANMAGLIDAALNKAAEASAALASAHRPTAENAAAVLASRTQLERHAGRWAFRTHTEAEAAELGRPVSPHLHPAAVAEAARLDALPRTAPPGRLGPRLLGSR